MVTVLFEVTVIIITAPAKESFGVFSFFCFAMTSPGSLNW